MSLCCTHCGADNDDRNDEDTQFCRECGAALFGECPKCGSRFRSGPKHCTSCGIDLARYAEAAAALVHAREHIEAHLFDRAIAAAEQGLRCEYLADELQDVRNIARRSTETVAALRDEAASLIAADRQEEAEAKLREALEIEPARDDLKAMLLELPDHIRRRDIRRLSQIARTLIEQGQYAEAAGVLAEAMKLDPDDERIQALMNETAERPKMDKVAELVASAQRLMDAKRYKAAGIKLRDALRLAPSRGDIAAAIDDLPDRIRRHDLDTALLGAREALAAGNFPAALENCTRALSQQSDHPEAADMKCRALVMRDDHDQRLSRAREFADGGRYDLAVAEFAAVAGDYPWDRDAAAEHEEIEERARKVSRLRLRAREQAADYEKRGALGAALATWRKLADMKDDDEEAAAERDRLAHRVRRRRITRTAAVIVATVALAGGVYGLYEALENQNRLDVTRTYIERKEFSAARKELKKCGWISLGKADVAAALEKAEFDWNLGQGARLAAGDSPDFAAAARHYLVADAILPGLGSVRQGIKTVKAAWLGEINKKRRAREYEEAEMQAARAVEIFPRDEDESFARILNEVRSLRNALPLELDLGGAVKMKFTSIPAGRFVMGSPDNEPLRGADEGPQRRITISSRFYMGATEVTQAQYRAVMGESPSRFVGSSRPVERVSWQDAVKFCQRLSARTGRKVKLPTEAQWEYACRAGTTGPFYCGTTIGTDQANYDGDYVYADGAKGGDRQKTMPVASFPANPWGLYDMHGNVQEWCADWYGPYIAATAKDPAGPAEGTHRVLRGGYWDSAPSSCRSASRDKAQPTAALPSIGFRVVLELD